MREKFSIPESYYNEVEKNESNEAIVNQKKDIDVGIDDKLDQNDGVSIEDSRNNLSKDRIASFIVANMQKIMELDEDEYEQMFPYSEKLIDTTSYTGGGEGRERSIHRIYSWYESAITRRDRQALSYERFNRHFFESPYTGVTFMYGEEDKGYLMGYERYGIFIPTHFCPKTMRSGYDLMKKLGRDDIPVIMAVTDDLKETISKMAEWKIEDIAIEQEFRGQSARKEIIHNNIPNVKEILNLLVGNN